jgi:hypothetical protein
LVVIIVGVISAVFLAAQISGLIIIFCTDERVDRIDVTDGTQSVELNRAFVVFWGAPDLEGVTRIYYGDETVDKWYVVRRGLQIFSCGYGDGVDGVTVTVHSINWAAPRW